MAFQVGEGKMESDQPCEDLKELLASFASGNAAAGEKLFPIMYDELHRLATACMQRERSDHTLGPTALIHEAYLRLVRPGSSSTGFENIEHFMSAAATVMRRILINHAHAKRAEKRGQGRPVLPLDDFAVTFEARSIDLLALNEALERLAEMDPKQARLVELRFFGGMTVEQCAEVLNMSIRSVYYEWALARAWLRAQIESK
jgi:RNA polymerase sigma-70 factor, ECF subfamily